MIWGSYVGEEVVGGVEEVDLLAVAKRVVRMRKSKNRSFP